MSPSNLGGSEAKLLSSPSKLCFLSKAIPSTCEWSQGMLVVKKPSASAGGVRDAGSIPGSGGSPGEGNGRPL